MAVYLISYGISYLLARQHMDVLSGLVLLGAAFWIYGRDAAANGNLIPLKGLFFLAFTGGQGISCLKLSNLQTDWSNRTWLALLLVSVSFDLAFQWYEKWRKQGNLTLKQTARFHIFLKNFRERLPFGRRSRQQRLLAAITVLTLISFGAFLTEALCLGFVPMLSYGVPHAYSEFHISGVHYFTVSCVLTPGLSLIYGQLRLEQEGRLIWDRSMAWAGGMTVVSLLIPMLCVSRFQLILAVILAVFTYISLKQIRKLRYLLVPVLCLVPAYLLLTVLRSHSVEYLNGIFEMKNSRMPIFITQPYMYIANNYDNFNCLTEELTEYAMGRRMLFPVWVFTGLKFLAPCLVAFPLYVTKKELTTVTLVYDAYYDFGLPGMVLFGMMLGLVCSRLKRQRSVSQNPVFHLLYGQIAIYLALSFFTTWFSNPTTWFYLGVTGLIYFYIEE